MSVGKRQLLSFYAVVALFSGMDMGLMIGLFWSSLQITGSPLALGLVLCVSVLLPFSLQRVARRRGKVLILGFRHMLVTRAAGFLLVLGGALAGLFNALYGFVLIALLVGLLGFFTTSTLEAVNARFMLAKLTTSASSARWMQTAIQLGAFVGAALAGIVLEWAGIDRFALLFSTIACVAALAVLSTPLGPPRDERAAASAVGDSNELQTDYRNSQLLQALCLGLGMIGFHIGAFNTLTPVIYQMLKHWSAADFGLASGVAGVGAFLAAVLPTAKLPDYVPPLLILLMDAVLVYSGITAVSIGACFLIGFSINHLRIQFRKKLIDLARGPADADHIASVSAFYYLFLQSAAPLILTGLITEPLFGRQAAPEIFVLVAVALLFSVVLLPRLAGSRIASVCLRFTEAPICTSALLLPALRRSAADFSNPKENVMIQHPYVIIVDPFSSGTLYAPKFASLGYACVAVRSSPHISARFARAFQPADFLEGKLFDIDEALTHFGTVNARAVVAGCEMAVASADALAQRLDLPGNPGDSTMLRRNKYPMQQALAAAALRNIPSLFIRNPEQIDTATAELEEIAYVVKPVNSASTDGVRFAQGRDGTRQALRESAWSQVNDLGEVNQGFVVQPFIEGPEYVIDLVAHAGGYTVASVCIYNKVESNGSRFVYAGLEVLDPQDPQYTPLLDYARQAAAALGLRVGPLHMELIWSKDGPVLIEAGARMHGGVAPALFNDCYSPNLLDLAVDASLGRTINVHLVQRRQHGRIVFLIAREKGVHLGLSPENEARLQQLRSYRGHRTFIDRGGPIVPTVDLATCPGIVWLANPDPKQLASDDMYSRTLATI